LGVEPKKKAVKAKNLLKIEFVKNLNGSFDKYVDDHLKAKNANGSNIDLYVSNILIFVPAPKGKRTVKVIVDGKDKTTEILNRLKAKAAKEGFSRLSIRKWIYAY
jgi:hypothetical protein